MINSSSVSVPITLPPSLSRFRDLVPSRLPLARIHPDPRMQVRKSGLNHEHLRSLRLSDPQGWQPILVVGQGTEYLVIDGFHRYTMAAEKGLAQLWALVLPVDPSDVGMLRQIGVEMNSQHGKPLTSLDRRMYAMELRQRHPEWSNARIAEAAHMTEQAVRRMVLYQENRSAYRAEEFQEQVRKLFQQAERVGNRLLQDGVSVEEMAQLVGRHLTRLGSSFVPTIRDEIQVAAAVLLEATQTFAQNEGDREESEQQGA